MEIVRQFEELLVSRLSESLNTMQIIIGARQVGKTTGVKHIFDNWNGSKLMFSADLPSPPDSNWIIKNWHQARALNENVLLIFDEFQKIPRWSDTVKLLFDEDRAKRHLRVVLLGSASLSLGLGLNETLAGRFELIKVPHWSFGEMVSAFNFTFEQYIRYGGYPAASDFINDPVRWQTFVRDSIVEPALSKDIFGLVSIKKPSLFRQVFAMVMNYPAQVLSYHKLVAQLQELGNISTVQHYLEILESAFLIKRIFAFSKNFIKEKSSSPKLLPLCPALVHAFVDPERCNHDASWKGRLIEVVVGCALVNTFSKVSYWAKSNYEVDFIVEEKDRIYAIEVKTSRARSLSGMNMFTREYPNAIPVVVDNSNRKDFLHNPRIILK